MQQASSYQRGVNFNPAVYATLVPLLLFALPMGAGNSISQPLALIALLPLLLFFRRKSVLGIAFIMYFVCVTIVQGYIVYSPENSAYQAVRSGLTLAIFSLIISDYKEISQACIHYFKAAETRSGDIVEKIILVYLGGQLLQVTLFQLGIHIANASSFSAEGRVLLFPASSTIIIFFYGCYRRKMLVSFLSALILLASGSKAVILSMAAVALIALLKQMRIRAFISYTAAVIAIIVAAFQFSPTSVKRMEDFLINDRGVDYTRDYEIYHAKSSWMRDGFTILMGNGFARSLSPGIPTTDPRWAENSKYDVENAYWGMLSKLGLVGVILFLALLMKLPKDLLSAATLSVWAIMGFKTSYQFLTTFDGCFLLLTSFSVRYLIYHRRNPSGPSAVLANRWERGGARKRRVPLPQR